MQPNFQLVDQALDAFAQTHSRYHQNEQGVQAREEIKAIVENDVFWMEQCQQVVRSDSLQIEILPEQSSNLTLLNNLVELLTNQLLPVKVLIGRHTPLIKQFKLMLLRHWLLAFSNGHYEQEFETLIEFFSRVIGPICENSGRTLEQLLDGFTEDYQSFNEKPLKQQEMNDLHQALSDSVQAFQKKTRQFEERVLATEKQKVSNQNAMLKARSLIDAELENKVIPKWCSEFINEHWHRLLHLALIKKDEMVIEQSAHYLTELAETFLIEDAKLMMQAISQTIAPLRKNIRSLFATIVVDPSVLEDFFSRLEEYHIAVMQGYPLHQEMVRYKSDATQDAASASVDPKVVNDLKVGNWFKLRINDKSYHARIIDRDLKTQRIVLVNYSGVRVASYSFHECQEKLNSKQMLPIHLVNALPASMIEIKQYIDIQIASISQKLKEREHQKEQNQRRKEELEQRLKEQREEQARLIKQKQEEQRRAKLAYEERLKKVLVDIQGYTPGTTFVVHENPNEPDLVNEVLQIVIRLKHSNKLVLVDKRGVKRMQLDDEQLARQLLNNDMELLSTVESTESTLEKMVAAQRSARNENRG